MNDTLLWTWGQRLLRRRKYLRLSQTCVAKYLGRSRQHVAEIEKGRKVLRLDELMKLTNLYRFPPWDLFKKEGWWP